MKQSSFQISSGRSRVKTPARTFARGVPFLAFGAFLVYIVGVPHFIISSTTTTASTDEIEGTPSLRSYQNETALAKPETTRRKPPLRPPPALPLIPHTIFFTYKHNILENKEPSNFYDNIMYTIHEYRTLWGDPDAPVRFLDNDDCVKDIEMAEPRLVPLFQNAVSGAWMADVCRIAALYNSGGYYFDIDLKVVQPVDLRNNNNISFVTVHETAVYMNFFQAFIASTPRNPILKIALDKMLDYHEGRLKIFGNLGPYTLNQAYKSVSPQEQAQAWILHELDLDNKRTPSNSYPEVQRQEGEGCCCNFVVEDAKQKQVYFFSRFVGASSKCGMPER